MITAENPAPTPEQLAIAQTRLRAFICEHLRGQCKIISLGEGCLCALCDFDRMRAAISKAPQSDQRPFVAYPGTDVWTDAKGRHYAMDANKKEVRVGLVLWA
jgi:hypothetical protein